MRLRKILVAILDLCNYNCLPTSDRLELILCYSFFLGTCSVVSEIFLQFEFGRPIFGARFPGPVIVSRFVHSIVPRFYYPRSVPRFGGKCAGYSHLTRCATLCHTVSNFKVAPKEG